MEMKEIGRTMLEDRMTVTLDELKSHVRILNDDFDAQLRASLTAAIDSAENYCNNLFTVYQARFSSTFAHTLIIPVQPVLEVTEVLVDGRKLEPSDYTVMDELIVFSDSVSGQDVQVTSVVGRETIAPAASMAILLIASSFFTNPVDRVESLPKASTVLLGPYRNFPYYNGRSGKIR